MNEMALAYPEVELAVEFDIGANRRLVIRDRLTYPCKNLSYALN